MVANKTIVDWSQLTQVTEIAQTQNKRVYFRSKDYPDMGYWLDTVNISRDKVDQDINNFRPAGAETLRLQSAGEWKRNYWLKMMNEYLREGRLYIGKL